MNKFFAFTIFFLLTLATIGRAQIQTATSIVPELSDSYLDKLVAVAKANYPHVKMLHDRVEVAKNNINKAKVSYLDPFTISYVYQPNNTLNLYQSVDANGNAASRQSLFNGAQIGVFFSLGALVQKPFLVKQAKREMAVADDEQQEYLLNLTALVRKRYYTYIQKIAALKLQSQASIDAASLLQVVKHKFEKNEETLDNYTKAMITVSQQNESKTAAEANLFSARADLEELLGVKLEDVK